MWQHPKQPRIDNWCQLRKRELSDLCEGFRLRSRGAVRKLRKEKAKERSKEKDKAKAKDTGKEKEEELEVDG